MSIHDSQSMQVTLDLEVDLTSRFRSAKEVMAAGIAPTASGAPQSANPER